MQSAFTKVLYKKSYAESKQTDTANNRKEGDMGIIENMRLDGKAIYVTGAASGIGKCAAMAFAEAGADVAIVDINLEGAQKVADEIAEKTGSKTIAIECDVTKQDQVEAMVAKVVDTYGKLDACYNNAGIAVNAPAEEMTLAQWQKVIDINLTGVFLCATAAGRVMLKQGYGSIINTASMSGHIVNVPQPQCGYNASKAGVSLLTKSLAVEWAKKGVRVNCISPGYIGTDLIMSRDDLKPLIGQWNAMAPMGRLGKPEELQSILVYLAGDTSTFTTGSDIIVDGAFTCF